MFRPPRSWEMELKVGWSELGGRSISIASHCGCTYWPAGPLPVYFTSLHLRMLSGERLKGWQAGNIEPSKVGRSGP